MKRPLYERVQIIFMNQSPKLWINQKCRGGKMFRKKKKNDIVKEIEKRLRIWVKNKVISFWGLIVNLPNQTSGPKGYQFTKHVPHATLFNSNFTPSFSNKLNECVHLRLHSKSCLSFYSFNIITTIFFYFSFYYNPYVHI